MDSYAFIQANLQRKKLATNELLLEAVKRKAAAALIQEPYVGGQKSMKSQRGVRIFQNTGIGEGTVKAVIAIFDSHLDVIQYPELTTNNIVVVGIQTGAWKVILVSYYFEPDLPMAPYLNHIAKICEATGVRRLIIGGDANAKSTWWGSINVDNRGEEMAGTLHDLNLQVLNIGDTPTFDTIRGGIRYHSFVDVTACSTDMLELVEDWRVEENLTSSDHNGITFNIRLKKSKGTHITRTTRIYNTKKANWEQFNNKLNQLKIENNLTLEQVQQLDTKTQIETAIQTYTKIITESCTNAIPIKKTEETLTIPWWSAELDEKKKRVTTLRRRIRNAAPVRRAKVVDEYLKQKSEYELEEQKAQVRSWKEFCEKQDGEGVWDGIYRVIGRTKKREEDIMLEQEGKVLDAKGSAKLLAETFYPEDSEEKDNSYHRHIRELAKQVNAPCHNETYDPPFTVEELKTASKSFNPKKAPGADGFTADICSRVISRNLDVFLALYNKCLQIGHFPDIWKEATVVVLRKPGKDDYQNPKAYRPIGLLPVLGKILEKMIVARIRWHLVPRISTRQYGFMPQRSTEDALYNLVTHIKRNIEQKKLVTLVSLDIEGAFDSAWWPAIKVRLAEEKCPVNVRRLLDSYLDCRKIGLRYAGEEHTRNTQKGCVQGSIGGPILWNLLLDPLIHGLEEEGVYCQAYADDVVMVFSGDTGLEISRQANAALAYVREWGVRNKLKFAPHKTCAMVLTRKLKYDTPRLRMGGIDIGMSREIKILGLTLDDKMTFNTHVAKVCKKAANLYKHLSRAAKVSWGLHPEVIRTIYTAVVEPVILYAAIAWAPSARKIGTQKALNAVQRGFAQKLCKSYRTVSLNSALVLAGILPLDLRIQEAAALYEARRGSSRLVLGDRETERVVGFAEIPHPALHVELTFESLTTQAQVDNSNGQAVKIYTDGSKLEGKVGAALSIWDGETETKAIKLSLAAYCTVYQAEILAICRATEEALKCAKNECCIYSDSRSALETITNYNALHPLAVKTRENLKKAFNLGKTVSFYWVKAHVGLIGNERADQLAKEAALSSRRRPDYDQVPVSFVKRIIRKDSLDEWNGRYKSGDTASVTKVFLPDVIDAYRTIRSIRPAGLLTQVFTGHGGLSQYLHRFKCKESPACVCDPDIAETIFHLLLDCPLHNRDRYDLQQRTEVELKMENLETLLKDKVTRKPFMEYCVKIINIVINRNKEV